jgi:hypothetical protein
MVAKVLCVKQRDLTGQATEFIRPLIKASKNRPVRSQSVHSSDEAPNQGGAKGRRSVDA